MTEISRPWAGTVTGDAGPYSDIQWIETWQSLIAPAIATDGVFDDQRNELDVTPGVNNAAMQTGSAMVDGTWYDNTAVVNVAIPDAAANPRIDRIVLRKSTAAQTVRITRIAGAEAVAPVPPAITQVLGVTWDLPLWQLHMAVAVGGTPVAYVDERSMIGQYKPAGYATEDIVYIEDEMFDGGGWTNAEFRRIWEAAIGGACVIAPVNTGTGSNTFTHSGVAGLAALLDSRFYRPDLMNARTLIISAEPNNDANLDRLLGYVSANADVTPANGVFFRTVGAGNWYGVTRAGGIESTTPVASSVPSGAAFKQFEIRQRGTTAVEFYINGTLIGVITTNIPAVLMFLELLILDNGGGCAAQTYMTVDLVRVRGDR